MVWDQGEWVPGKPKQGEHLQGNPEACDGGKNWLLRKMDDGEAPGADQTPTDRAPRAPQRGGSTGWSPCFGRKWPFRGWTEGGRLRHPSFQGLREDRPPIKVSREQPRFGKETMNRIAGVRLSNLDRVLYPEQGVTKRVPARQDEAPFSSGPR